MKRMVLIPEDMLNRYEQKQRIESSPITNNMLQKDTMMTNILQRTDVNDTDKKKLYNANMESYLELRRQKDSQIPTVRLAVDELNKEEGSEKMQLSDDVIVEHIPKTMRPRASALLNRLKARPDIISWDKTGQVRIDGVTIPQSNISDLVSDAMRARKNFNPNGSREFFRALSKINIPKDLVRNDERWKQILLDRSLDEKNDYQTPETSSRYASTPQRISPSNYFQTIVNRHEAKGTITPKRWYKY